MKKKAGLRGLPPPEYQCTATRRNGKRCRKWRMRGTTVCDFHQGPHSQRLNKSHGVSFLPKFYRTVLKGTLESFVKDCLELPPHEQLDFHEELALMRHNAMQAVALYSAAVQSEKTEIIANASELMKSALQSVVHMGQQVASIEATAKDKITVHTLAHMINQIVRIMHDHMEPEDAKRLELVIRDRVRMPTSGAEGTTLTPDQDAVDMDSTVPNR